MFFFFCYYFLEVFRWLELYACQMQMKVTYLVPLVILLALHEGKFGFGPR